MNRFHLVIKDRNVEILRTMYLQALRMIIGQKGFSDFIWILSYNISWNCTPYYCSQGIWVYLIYQPQKLSSFIIGVQLAPRCRTGPTFWPSGWDRPCCHFISDLKIELSFKLFPYSCDFVLFCLPALDPKSGISSVLEFWLGNLFKTMAFFFSPP